MISSEEGGDAGGTDTGGYNPQSCDVRVLYMTRGTLCAPGKTCIIIIIILLFVCISSIVYIRIPKRRKDVLLLQRVFSLMHVIVAFGASALGLSTSRDVPVAL